MKRVFGSLSRLLYFSRDESFNHFECSQYFSVRKKRSPVRKYDILSSQQLNQIVVDSDSEDDIYDTSSLVKPPVDRKP